MVMVAGGVAALWLPEASVAVAVKLCSPSASAGVTIDQAPVVASATTVPMNRPFSYTFTVLPGSAEPVTVITLMLVTPSIAPVSGPTEVIAGTEGGAVSTVMPIEFDGELVLPASSVAVAV